MNKENQKGNKQGSQIAFIINGNKIIQNRNFDCFPNQLEQDNLIEKSGHHYF